MKCIVSGVEFGKSAVGTLESDWNPASNSEGGEGFIVREGPFREGEGFCLSHHHGRSLTPLGRFARTG